MAGRDVRHPRRHEGVEHLANVMTGHGSWSVISEPGVSFAELAKGVRNGTVRRTTVREVLAAGGQLTPTPGGDAPPYHCDLTGLTTEAFDFILGAQEPNPVPPKERWRGENR